MLREEEDKKLAQMKKDEEDRLRREIEEKKQKDMEEKRRRLAEVEQKRQVADKASKVIYFGWRQKCDKLFNAFFNRTRQQSVQTLKLLRKPPKVSHPPVWTK